MSYKKLLALAASLICAAALSACGLSKENSLYDKISGALTGMESFQAEAYVKYISHRPAGAVRRRIPHRGNSAGKRSGEHYYLRREDRFPV